MLKSSLFKTHFLGKDGFIWWIGQIVDRKVWVSNVPGAPTRTTEEQKGFDFRYKVRIMGYHTCDKEELKDEQLPWASIMLPVTAGVSGGSVSTPNLRQGNFVYGFFLDGEDGQQPIIMGVIGHNQYQAILTEPPEKCAFVPFSGYDVDDTRPVWALPLEENDSDIALPEDVKKEECVNKTCIEASTEVVTEQNGGSKEQKNGEKRDSTISSTSKCEPAPMGPIQTKVKNMITQIQEIKKIPNDWETAVSTTLFPGLQNNQNLDQVEASILRIKNNAIKDISGDVKTFTRNVQENALKKVNDALSETYGNLYPSQLMKVKEKAEAANDELACAFKNIMKNLTGMVGNFLNQILDRFINTPMCAIENFVGSLLGKISGLIDGALDVALGPVRGLLAGMGAATSALDEVMGFATNALSFLSCDEDPNCPNVEAWNPTDGPQIKATLNLNSIFNKAKDAATSIKGAFTDLKDVGQNISDLAKNADFSDIFEDTCNVGPLFCGPPTVEFVGGGGSGATGNVIIGTLGSLLGVDIITPGGGYIGPPQLKFNDSCDNGTGASGTAVIEDGKVVKVVMDDTGTGYLDAPDGSQGGDGRTWADKDETTVKREDGTYDTPYKPGTVITVCPGDEVTSPGKKPLLITGTDCIGITAEKPPDQPIAEGYPVVLEIDSIHVSNPGLGYDCFKDEVVMEPAHGCEFKLRCNGVGSIIGVDVVKGCVGFKDDPRLYIKSTSGYNAKLMPVFKVNRVGEDIAPEAAIPGAVIQVVDCVGKF
tara:strand:- start:1114 stop:3408 length:2295 start_codon:yes stop_codon:yes gene_type:complete